VGTGLRGAGGGAARRQEWPPWAVGVLAGLVGLVWFGCIAPIAHFDVDVFLRAGAAVSAGRDPYPPAGSPEVYSGFAFVYPYLAAMPFVPLSRLGHGGAEVFIALSVLAVFAGCRLAGARGWRAYALVLVASCTITGLQMGTLNAVLFAGLAGLWRWRDRPAVAGALAALLVYSKLFLAPVLLWLALTRRWRAAGMSAAVLVLLFAGGELVSPVGAGSYADMLGVLARKEAPDGLSLTGLLMNTGLAAAAATWVARVAAVALMATCWARARASGDEPLLFAGTVAGALVASPIVWSHYLLLLVAPLCAIAVRPGTGDQPAADAPPAAFAVGSWLLVTPHGTTGWDLAVATVVLAMLAGPPLVAAARRFASRRLPPAPAPGRSGPVTARAAAAVAAGVGVAGAAWLPLRLLASAHGDAERVVGAYGTLLGVLIFLGWAMLRAGAGRPLRPPPAERLA
jgi:alpha-1,2-mannosyltransferase